MATRKRKQKRKLDRAESIATAAPSRDFTALKLALIGYAILWFSMTPLGSPHVSWLGWIAVTPLVWLIQKRDAPTKVLRQVWIASLLYWLVTLHFVRLPFWGLWFGWMLLATYLSIYGVLFVAVTRTMVHRLHVPVAIAAPVVFTGLEWIRVTFLTGFGMACLSHTQYQTPASLQIASLLGAYGLTFVMVMVSAALAMVTNFWSFPQLDSTTITKRFVHAAIGVAVAVGVLGFGTSKLAQDRTARTSAEAHRHLKVALIQSSHDKNLQPETRDQIEKKFGNLRDLTHAARRVGDRLDLIVWPEASFSYHDYLSDLNAEFTSELMEQQQFMAWRAAIGKPAPFDSDAIPMLVGTLTIDPKKDDAFNSAVLFGDRGTVQDRYFKNHLVMFGEYFPLVNSIPGLGRLFRGFSSLSFGTEFSAMEVSEVLIVPNICFESTVPHFIRRQVNSLAAAGEEADVLVNLTNDGWFLGTRCLDLHLACNVFRAVEMGKPMLVCANTGFSAHIDELGRIVQAGPRRAEAELICDVRIPFSVPTVYRRWGAWFASVCGVLTIAAGLWGRFA